MSNKTEIIRLVNEIEKLKAEAKKGDGYSFDVKPHSSDPEKWDHVMKTDYCTREMINEKIKQIWNLASRDVLRITSVSICESAGRSPLPLPPGTFRRKE